MAGFDLATTRQIIEEARNGRPFVIVDAADRENEGDVIIPAQYATPDAINFMARHARGLICLAITAGRATELDLKPMAERNSSAHGTAFTVSIEAREGVTTGISAFDRAHTINVATDPCTRPQDIATPGHVFPLVARDGGVLVRAGHTEAAVDIARIAGLRPAGVICEVMNADGSMARLPELVEFARTHGLRIGTIADLIAYRRQSETMVEVTAAAPFESHFGTAFRLHVFRNMIEGGEHLALVKGTIEPDGETLVRVHQVDLTVDLLGWSAARRDYVPRAMRALAGHPGPAVAVFVQDPDAGSLARRVNGKRREYTRTHSGRDYGTGAQILKALGVRRMALLTSSQAKLTALEAYDLTITRRIAIPETGCQPDLVAEG